MGARTTHPHQTLNHLNNQSLQYLHLALAPSTRSNYTGAIRTYQAFCDHHSLSAYPPTEHTLILYVTHVASYSSHGNIKLHTSAIKYFATVKGHYIDFTKFAKLYLVIRGIKRAQGKKFSLPPRQPITPQLLHKIQQNLFNSSGRYEDKVMLWAALTTAFYGFLRVSEYTSSHRTKFDPHTTLLFSDVTIEGDVAHIVIKASKTDPFRNGITIRLAANTSTLCPIAALKNFLPLHPTQHGPLFTYQDKKFLTRKELNVTLKSTTNGLANTSSHSLRIGAASTAAAMGCPRWLIQSMGRWSSDCFRTYIRVSIHTIINTSHILSHCTDTITSSFDPYKQIRNNNNKRSE